MSEGARDRIIRQLDEKVEQLQRDLKERGKEAAVDYARSMLGDLPRQRAADDFGDAVFDTLLRLNVLTEEHLIAALSDEQSHARARAWLMKNHERGSEVVSGVVALLLRGEQFPKKKRGPKKRADPFFQSVAKAVAYTLKEAGVPLYANEGNISFTAAEAIAEALGKEDSLPISPSLVRDWIS